MTNQQMMAMMAGLQTQMGQMLYMFQQQQRQFGVVPAGQQFAVPAVPAPPGPPGPPGPAAAADIRLEEMRGEEQDQDQDQEESIIPENAQPYEPITYNQHTRLTAADVLKYLGMERQYGIRKLPLKPRGGSVFLLRLQNENSENKFVESAGLFWSRQVYSGVPKPSRNLQVSGRPFFLPVTCYLRT